MAAKKKQDQQIAEWMYKVVQSPVVTEKSTMGSEFGQVTFRVSMEATKPQIKAAVEALFGVKVTGVNTMVTKGKTKRFRGHKGVRSDLKKAIVTLEGNETIDVGTGI